MQVSYGRLQAYVGMGVFSFAMIMMGSPFGNSGAWLGTMVMVILGIWIELSDDGEEEDDRDHHDRR
jgi:predicted PurR-regulated permease PerM